MPNAHDIHCLKLPSKIQALSRFGILNISSFLCMVWFTRSLNSDVLLRKKSLAHSCTSCFARPLMFKLDHSWRKKNVGLKWLAFPKLCSESFNRQRWQKSLRRDSLQTIEIIHPFRRGWLNSCTKRKQADYCKTVDSVAKKRIGRCSATWKTCRDMELVYIFPCVFGGKIWTLKCWWKQNPLKNGWMSIPLFFF